MSVHFDSSGLLSCGTLTGYAYETIPGRAIVAGQTMGTFYPLNP